jgi:phosphate uptake regulator
MPETYTILPGEIENNLQLIILETTKQVEDTQKVLKKPDPNVIEKILARDDYIDNLKSIIERESFYSSIKKKTSKPEADTMRSLYIIGNNLERIADFAVNIVRQTEHLVSNEFLKRIKYGEAFKEILESLKLIHKAFKNRDLNLGLKICRSEISLDDYFGLNLKRIMNELKAGGEHAESLVTTLFILQYLERMGDSLLNIGEAIIFATIGERVKIKHIESLDDSMGSIDMNEFLEELKIEAFLGTKSGCKISRVQKGLKGANEQPVIFKEGKISKIKKEKENIEAWESLKAGLPPKVFSFQKNGRTASILLEFLEGPTIQNSLLVPDGCCLDESFKHLKKILTEIWTKTLNPEPVCSNFIRQLKTRASDIYKAHPDFKLKPRQIGSLVTYSFEELIDECEALENKITVPFSVWSHGDFNLDNIIYDTHEHRMHFIDLYRSGRQDYVQDISVFLVSIFRLPIFVPKIRDRMNQFTLKFFQFGQMFSNKNGDPTFEARLALGLARSFFTSTRFEFDQKFSQTMQQRALYLLEKIASHQGRPWEDFKLVPKVLTYL